uniref:hypothetical protein n=1 Tax=Natrialba chahannaoensis TaxID=68911 RepID=UPI0009FF05B0|nr:hypothetical protein [Natrialba chahannaoensis]
MTDNLEPLSPAEAMQMYLGERSHELAGATIQSHRYRLKQFVQWCEQDGIDNLNKFSGRDTHSCPHDQDLAECDALPTERSHACASSLSPHPVHQGAITHFLQSDVPENAVSDRMDANRAVLDRHYDQRSEREKLRQRRQYLPSNSDR